MAGFEQQFEEQQYVMIAKIVEERKGKRSSIYDYSLRYEGEIPYEKVNIVLRKFLKNIDDKTFVSLREIEKVRNPYDVHHFIFGRNNYDFKYYYFYILKKEIPKIETVEPMHIVCEADELPKNKEKFLEFLKRVI